MLKDKVNFTGHFKIQSIDKRGHVIDEWQEQNMIMEDARETMSEIFGNMDTNTFIEKLVLGTEGHASGDIATEKTSSEGFVKERDRLFSEPLAGTVNTNDILSDIRLNDYVYAEPDTATNGYYRYVAATTTNYTVTDADLTNTSIWIYEGVTAPYLYNITFELPGTKNNIITGDGANNIVEDDAASGSTVKILQSGTSLSFFIDIATGAANSQDSGTSIFTEAALYANSRIFSMKTFKAKIKDTSVLLRIEWVITF